MNKSSKLVFSKTLKGQISESDRKEVSKADNLVDESLDCLNFEEPSLKEFLEQDPDLRNVYKATISTMYCIVLRDLMADNSLHSAFDKTNTVLFRTIAAVAHRAAMKERELNV